MIKLNFNIFSMGKSFRVLYNMIINIATPLENPYGYKYVKDIFKKLFNKTKLI